MFSDGSYSNAKESNNKTRFWHKDTSVIDAVDIGDGCTIHALVWIAEKVKIGNNCKIQAMAYLPNGVVLEDNVFIGPGVIFTNDKYPKANMGKEWEQMTTTVKEGANIGANATILPGLTIGKGATIGAGSVVTKDVPDGELWYGNPDSKKG